MSPIVQALSSGHNAEEILDYLIKAIPALAPRVSQAKRSGHATSSILDFLSKTMQQEEYPSGASEKEIGSINKKRQERFTQQLLKTAALTAGSGLLAARAAPAIAEGISNLIPNRKAPPQTPSQQGAFPVPNPQSAVPNPSPAPTPQNTASQPVANAMQTGNVPEIPEQNISTIPQNSSPAQIQLDPQVKQLIESSGLGKKIQSLLKRNAPETIGNLLKRSTNPRHIQDIENISKRPFSDILGQYAKEIAEQKEADSLSPDALARQAEKLQPKEPTNVPVEEKNPMASKSALLPSGEVGTITDEKQGIGTVELADGTKRRKKLDELIEAPEDAAVQALELIKSFTPEQERSTHHALSFYDPDEKNAYFLFHDGNAYLVGDINPEEYEKLSTEMEVTKTSGQSPYGVYAVGAKGRGTAYNSIIKAGKKPYRKLQVGYNLFKEFQRHINERAKKERRKKTNS